MRVKKKYTTMSVSQENHDRLIKDRDHFQKTIDGGKWSIDDTLTEYFKILDTLK